MTPSLPIRTADAREPIKAVSFSIDDNYLENLRFSLLAGRNVSGTFSTDTNEAVIVNETAALRLGFEDAASAVGQGLILGETGMMTIVGVTSDFHYARLQNAIDPVVLRFSPDEFAFAMVRVASNDMSKAVAPIEQVWSMLSVDLRPFQYNFMDEFVQGAYNDMKDIIVFLSIIAGLAIGIACLGLLGMAIFSTETQVKEIGIRKVFGASAFAVMILLSRDLVKLLVVAVVIVTPLLWAFITFMFLERVAYRVELGAEMFLPGFFLVLLLAFLTIGSQTIKAANGNPVEALRHD